jgi:hypothetical protein
MSRSIFASAASCSAESPSTGLFMYHCTISISRSDLPRCRHTARTAARNIAASSAIAEMSAGPLCTQGVGGSGGEKIDLSRQKDRGQFVRGSSAATARSSISTTISASVLFDHGPNKLTIIAETRTNNMRMIGRQSICETHKQHAANHPT